jgi:cellulose synthase/poly-beta-1,6-N-acetylglucosamine synthase-like glycosyltransferase
MLLTLTLVLFWTIVLIVAIHYGALLLFLRGISQKEWNTPAIPLTPKTAVILTLRGADPFLNRCVEGLLKQDYPNYTAFLVVDHISDPALPVVKNIVKTLQVKNVEIVIVDEHLKTCTLKCNSLIHVTKNLDPSYEVVVILDADTNPHSNWLRHLIEPLSDSRFGAATGQRWYMPEKDNFGSLVRYLWNAAAVVQLYLYRIAWGGSLALKRSLFTEGKLGEHWSQAFTDDAAITTALNTCGLRTAFVPSLFMVNRETCTLTSFHRWVKRQLLCAKLHHPAWNAVIVQAMLITLPLLAAFFLLLFSLIQGNYSAAGWSLASLVLYWAGVFGTLPIMERGIRNKLRERNELMKPWTFGTLWRTLLAIPLTQCVYTSSLFWLHFMKRVEWRGVEYDITGGHVRMIEYKPYTIQPTEQEEGHSL